MSGWEEINQPLSFTWLHFRIIWGTVKTPDAQTAPQANYMGIFGVGPDFIIF